MCYCGDQKDQWTKVTPDRVTRITDPNSQSLAETEPKETSPDTA